MPLGLVASKSVWGHAEPAAGLVALQHVAGPGGAQEGVQPQTLHLRTVNHQVGRAERPCVMVQMQSQNAHPGMIEFLVVLHTVWDVHRWITVDICRSKQICMSSTAIWATQKYLSIFSEVRGLQRQHLRKRVTSVTVLSCA